MGVLIEGIRHGWGYDTTGRWHEQTADVVPIREAAETVENDPLAPARGTMCGLLSGVIFWLLIGGATKMLWLTAKR
jgi:hypothetical protein